MDADYDYHGYTIYNVYHAVPAGLRDEIIDLWRRNRILPHPDEAERRVDEVVLVIRGPAGQIVGVSTVYIGDFQQPGNSYYFYRMFIQPADRIPGLMRFVALRTREILKAQHVPGTDGPQGVIHVNENQKLMRPGMKRMFERNGYEYLGRGPKGNDIWRYLF